jgi:translation initiation factor 2 alpha subunit (eIF-2alpha)
MSKLYELSESFRKLYEIFEDALDNDELDADSEEMFLDTLESLEGEISFKVENICKFIKNIDGDIKALKAEEDRLSKKRKAMENKVESLKKYMSDMLINAKIKEVKAGNFKVKFQASPPSVEILNPELIPAQYREPQEDKILKSEIMKELKDKKEVAGAKLVDDKVHLRIT